MRTFITIVGAVVLALSCVTASDAREHAKRQAPTQSEPTQYDQQRGGDCPMFRCPTNGG